MDVLGPAAAGGGLAEEPRLYIPQWTDEIMNEVTRNLMGKFKKSPEQAKYREDALRKHFPSAWIDEGYKLIIPSMTNDPKDRHVLAAAVRSNSELIVTYNKKHFPVASTEPFGIACKGPSAFLRDLYDLEPAIVTRKLADQARNVDLSVGELLERLRGAVPGFVEFINEEQKNSA